MGQGGFAERSITLPFQMPGPPVGPPGNRGIGITIQFSSHPL